jgi:probable F420-dependent oxidoreductase
MRFSYAEAMTEPSYYVPLARAAEEAGFDTMLIADSIAYPAESASTYPYNRDGTRTFLQDKPFIEPFVLIAALAATTSRLRFLTNVLKLPIRPPALVAKQASSLAVVSDNRLVLGVGLSPWPEDYELCAVPWTGRGKRMDEAIDVIRGFTSGDWFEYHGKVFAMPRAKMTPAPSRPIPIVVGGHGDAALRRAARTGDGWICAGLTETGELSKLISKLRAFRAEYERLDIPFEIHAASMLGFSPDGVRQLAELGVTDVSVGFRDPYTEGADTEPLEKKIHQLQRFGERVIAKVRE